MKNCPHCQQHPVSFFTWCTGTNALACQCQHCSEPLRADGATKLVIGLIIIAMIALVGLGVSHYKLSFRTDQLLLLGLACIPVIIGSFIGFALGGYNCRSMPLSKQQVAAQFIAALQQRFPAAQISLDGDEIIQFKHPSALESNLHLGNLYQAYAGGGNSLANLISHHLGSIEETISNHTSGNKGQILPVVKPKEFLAATEQQIQLQNPRDTNQHLYSAPLAEDLLIFYAYDGTQGIRYLTQEDAQGEQELHQRAMENLFALCNQQQLGLQPLNLAQAAGVYQFQIDGHYDASVLLAAELIHNIEQSLGDVPIIFPAARDTVLIAPRRNAQAVQMARFLAQNAFAEFAYTISPHGYFYNGTAIERYVQPQ